MSVNCTIVILPIKKQIMSSEIKKKLTSCEMLLCGTNNLVYTYIYFEDYHLGPERSDNSLNRDTVGKELPSPYTRQEDSVGT